MSSESQRSLKQSLPTAGQNTYCYKSIHSKLGFTLGLISMIIIFYIGYPNIFKLDNFYQQTGILAMFESTFAFIGLFFTDLLRGEKTRFRKKLKDDQINSLIFAIFLFLILGLIQTILGVFSFAISDTEIDLLIILAAPAEELFFRGFIVSIFISFNKKAKSKSKFLVKEQLSILPVIGIIISSVFFSRLHVFKYDDISFLLAIFIGGILLGFYYWFTQDLTACILAHLFLNITALYGYLVFLSISLISIYYVIIHFKRFIQNFPDLNVLEGSSY